MKKRYEIVVYGHLTEQWSLVFEGMDILCRPDGTTRIAGDLPDQAALFGLLMKVRDLGLLLISIHTSPVVT